MNSKYNVVTTKPMLGSGDLVSVSKPIFASLGSFRTKLGLEGNRCRFGLMTIMSIL